MSPTSSCPVMMTCSPPKMPAISFTPTHSFLNHLHDVNTPTPILLCVFWLLLVLLKRPFVDKDFLPCCVSCFSSCVCIRMQHFNCRQDEGHTIVRAKLNQGPLEDGRVPFHRGQKLTHFAHKHFTKLLWGLTPVKSSSTTRCYQHHASTKCSTLCQDQQVKIWSNQTILHFTRLWILIW